MSSDRELGALLQDCARLGVSLRAEAGSLRVSGPKGGVPPELLERVRALKPLLLKRLDNATGRVIPRPGLDAFPLSPTQRRLWFLARLEEDAAVYNMPLALRLDGRLDAERLEAALACVLERQTALRSVVVAREDDGEPWQELRPLRRPALDLRDLSQEANPEDAFRDFARAEANRPFDLARGPLCRASLLRLGEARHNLLLVTHHLVSDYQSMGVLLRELEDAYAHPGRSATPPLRYADYCLWLRTRQSDAAAEARRNASLDACAEVLRGAPRLLTLPWDRPRPKVQSTRGGALRFAAPAELAADVAELGRSRGCTPFMTWLALWGLLLGRLSGQHDVTVGCPTSFRPPEAEDCVGLFVDTAVMRLRCEANPTLPAYLDASRTGILRVLASQDAPFERLTKRLAPERGLDHTPLFQAMFVMHDAPRRGLDLPGVRAEILPLAGQSAEFDLNLALEPQADGSLAAHLEYSAALFDEATVGRWAGHLLCLARAAVERPKTQVLDLPLMEPETETRLVQSWSGAAAQPPEAGPLLPQSLREACGRWPERVALADASGETDYTGLAAWSTRIAMALERAGLGPGEVAGVLLPRSRAWVAALLGAWRADAAFVALDPDVPPKRLQTLADQAGVRTLLVRAETAGLLPGAWTEIRIDRLETTSGPATQACGGHRDTAAAPDGLALLTFTSGSSGAPKAVRTPHSALAFHAAATARLFALQPGEAVLQFAAPGFDVAMEELWPALLSGCRVEILPDSAKTSLEEFDAFLRRQRVAVANLPARFWEAWTEHLASQGLAAPPDLRLLITGSEAVDPAALAAWRRLPGGGRSFLSGYGPSEATVSATFYDPSRDGLPRQTSALPLGRPLPGVRAYVLDERLRPVPPGCAGELCLAGPGLALGYLNRTGDAAQAFAPDPFRPGERLYHTRDLARFAPQEGDGPALLLFEGRLDRQVKRRGYRIEPGEMEAALARLPEVALAVALPLEDGRITALAELAPGTATDAEALRRALAEGLPGYLLPDHILLVERLPLLASGKADLPAAAALARELLTTQAMAGAGSGEAPRPGPEQTLADIWVRVLRVPAVRRDDNFFRLGGDSILALRVVSLAARAGLRLAPHDLFQGQTLAELAVLARPQDVSPPEQGPLTGAITPTPLMAWLLEQPQEFADGLSMGLALRLPMPASLERLRAAAETLLNRHDMLRLRLDGERRPILAAPAPGLAEAAVIQTAPGGLRAAAAVPFDLARGPLLRLIRCAERPDRLLIQVHHLVVDAVSWGVLLEELAALLREGPAAALPARTSPCPAFAERLRGEPLRRMRQRLEALYAEAEPLAEQGEKPTAQTEHELVLPPELAAALYAHGPTGGPSPGERVLAGLGLALARLRGARTWLLDVEGHGRNLPADRSGDLDLSRTVGWFTSMTPARFDLSDSAELFGGEAGRAIWAARRALRGAGGLATAHAALRLDVDGARLLAGLPRPDVLFNHLGALDAALPPGMTPDDDGVLLPPQPLSHALEVNSLALGGRAALRLGLMAGRWPDGFAAELLHVLPDCLAEAAAFAGEIPASPADFPLAEAAGLDAGSLRRMERRVGPLDDVYPLSPLQHGMLFHTLRDERSGEYFDQFTCLLEVGPDFSPERLRAAWDRTLARHDALRAAFFWNGLREPLQAVVRQASIPLEVRDWRGLTEEARNAALKRLLDEDRARPFDLTRPPLMRMALCREDVARWRMVWSNHHLLLDGWSLPLLLDEVGRTYAGAPPAAPAPTYREFIAWLARQDSASAQAFWREELSGFDSPTPPPLARSGLAPSGRWPQVVQRLRRNARASVETAQRRAGLTLSALVQGAWALLLSRYGGGRDVLFGATVSGRPPELPGADRIIGSCIATLPVRVAIPHAAAVGQWLAELGERQAQRQAHGQLDLVEITRLAALPPGVQPFNSLVLVQNYPHGDPDRQRGEGLRLEGFEAFERTNYALTLAAYADANGLDLNLSFDPTRYDHAAAEQILTHLRTLMTNLAECLAQAPETPLDAVEMLTAEELRRVREWNGTAREFPWRGPWHGLFEAHAVARPDAPAVEHGEHTLRYGELDRMANRLANRLRALGAGPETFIGIWLERSPELVMAVLGILKASAAYVPLDPDYPTDRLALMLGDTRPLAIVTTSRLLPRIPAGWATQALCLDREAEALAALPDTAPPCAAGPDNAAFVVFTSGSTGWPKGSVTLHGGLTNLAQTQIEHLRTGPGSRVLQFFSLSFDAASWEILMALCSGGTLVLGSQRELQPGPPLFDFLRKKRITHLTVTPSALAVTPAPAQDSGPGSLPDLRMVLTGGEACDQHLAERWAAGRRFHHGYGPSEATVCCSAPLCRDFSGRLPLGRALSNMTMYVLDDRLRPCPVGATGEICIGGAGVARGYLNNPELTAQKFVPDPFADRPGSRLYRSGDLGRWRPNGDIEFAGRADFQVKVRGYRIELGEIEAALARHPEVDQALVLAEAPEGDPSAALRLLAYVTGRDAARPKAEELLLHLKGLLPAYMIPAHVLVLDAFPLTANMKVDRAALPRPAGAPRAGMVRVPPATRLEERVAAIWRDILELQEIGMEENFFDLGGNSLLVVRLCSAINSALGVDLQVTELFDLPTVRQLARRLGDAPGAAASSRRDPTEQAQRRQAGRETLQAQRRLRGGRA